MAKSFIMEFCEGCVRDAETHPYGSYTILYDDGREDMLLLRVYPGTNHNPYQSGFGGELFKFRTPSGEIIESNNCWHRTEYSKIPKTLRNKFEVWTKV